MTSLKFAHIYKNHRISVGHLEGEPPTFVPNKSFSQLLHSDKENQSLTGARDRLVIDAIRKKYGEVVPLPPIISAIPQPKTATAVFLGPSIVFGGITSRYRLDTMLRKAFGEDDAKNILSLAWYIASEGGALSNSDVWLDHFETPAGHGISSQEISRLLDRMVQDDILTFYKEWLSGLGKTNDRILYDLTSISWHGNSIDLAGWGHNRDKESLPQVNFALLCVRKTAMPLFA